MNASNRVKRCLRTVFSQSIRQGKLCFKQCTKYPKKLQNCTYVFGKTLITVSKCSSISFHIESNAISLGRLANYSFSSQTDSDDSENFRVSGSQENEQITPTSNKAIETYRNSLQDDNVLKSPSTNNSKEINEAISELVTKAAKLDVMIHSLNSKKLQKDIGQLIDVGFPIVDLQILCKFPRVFLNLSRFTELTQLLYSLGYRQKDIIIMFSNYPPVMLYTAEDFISIFKSLNKLGFRAKNIVNLTVSCPVVLEKDPKMLQARLSALQELFKTQDVFILIGKSPHVLIDSMDSILEKFAYVSQEMGITQRQMMYSDLYNRSLQHLHTRHVYLLRTGYFRKVISDKQVSLNPSLDTILNTSDEEFVKRFGGLSVEEYNVFKALLKRDQMISNTGRNIELEDDDEAD